MNAYAWQAITLTELWCNPRSRDRHLSEVTSWMALKQVARVVSFRARNVS